MLKETNTLEIILNLQTFRLCLTDCGEGNDNPLQYSCLKIPWTEEPGRLQSMGSLRVNMTEQLHFHFSLSCIGEGNGNPPQYSCLKIPWTEEPGGLQLMASQRVGRDLARAHTRTHTHRDRETQREREGRNTHPKRKDMSVLPNEVKRQFNHLYGAVRLGLCSSLAKCLTSFPSSDLF